MQVTVNCKPSLFAYPAPITQEASTQVAKVPTAVLSTTARARQKAKKKEAASAKAGGPSGERKHAKSPAAKSAPRAGPPSSRIHSRTLIGFTKGFLGFSRERKHAPSPRRKIAPQSRSPGSRNHSSTLTGFISYDLPPQNRPLEQVRQLPPSWSRSHRICFRVYVGLIRVYCFSPQSQSWGSKKCETLLSSSEEGSEPSVRLQEGQWGAHDPKP